MKKKATNGHEAAEPKPAKRDQEIALMGKIWRSLSALDVDARRRVVSYLSDRAETPDPVQEPLPFPEVQ